MASIKQLQTRKYKITVSNGYRPDGRKISRAKTITVPDTVRKHQIPQYVAHQAEEFERLVKNGFCEDSSMRFEEYARRWLDRQSRYAPSTLASYRRMLEVVFPYIGAIPLCRLRPINMENLLEELRKRTCHGKPVQETTVQKYLTVVSAVLSDAKRNEILEKNPARMVALPQTQRSIQRVPSQAEVQRLLDALAREPRHYRLFYLLSLYTGCRRGELCSLQWGDIDWEKHSIHICRDAVKVTDKEIFTKAPETVSGDRYVFFSLGIESLLREYRQECAWETETYDGREPEDRDFLFRRRGCRHPMTPSTFNLAVQADPEKARPAGVSECPLPAAHQCQPAHRKRHRRGHGGRPSGPQPSTTLDICTHAFDKNKQVASRVLQEGLEV